MYDSGKLGHTTTGTWQHSNGGVRTGQIMERSFTDQFGNEFLYKVCRFEFDRLELLGDRVQGENVEMPVSGAIPWAGRIQWW